MQSNIMQQNNTINYGNCMSIKNKKSHLQCPNRRYLNSDYCGVHGRSKNIIRIDQTLNYTNESIKQIIHKKYKIIGEESVANEKITKSLILNCHNIDDLKISDLKNTLKRLNIGVGLCNNKRELYNLLHRYYNLQDLYERHLDKITRIQAIFRGYLVRKRKKCINNEDFFTLDNKYEIPLDNYFSYIDEEGFESCFDAISFQKLLENDLPTNPYTTKSIPQKVIEKFGERVKYLNKKGVKLNIEKPPMTDSQKLKQKMIAIFHKFDMLDNYTNHTWFEDLTLHQLKELYKRGEDIWNYRAQLNMQQKKNIVSNGIAFDIPISVISNIKENKKRILQNILLCEFDRFATQGINKEERKLGAMLILTTLVEVSMDAAYAMPHYVQIY